MMQKRAAEEGIEVFAAELPLAEVMERLVRTSSLADKVTIVHRPSGEIGAEHMVTEFYADGLPISAWSSGEVRLWGFLASLAGAFRVNLASVANYLAGGPQTGDILTAFSILMDGADQRVG